MRVNLFQSWRNPLRTLRDHQDNRALASRRRARVEHGIELASSVASSIASRRRGVIEPDRILR
eukprot:5013129-Prymnesium_polylepis.1